MEVGGGFPRRAVGVVGEAFPFDEVFQLASAES